MGAIAVLVLQGNCIMATDAIFNFPTTVSRRDKAKLHSFTICQSHITRNLPHVLNLLVSVRTP